MCFNILNNLSNSIEQKHPFINKKVNMTKYYCFTGA